MLDFDLVASPAMVVSHSSFVTHGIQGRGEAKPRRLAVHAQQCVVGRVGHSRWRHGVDQVAGLFGCDEHSWGEEDGDVMLMSKNLAASMATNFDESRGRPTVDARCASHD